MTVTFSKYTPEEPDWEKEIQRLREAADVYNSRSTPGTVYDVTDIIFKFSSTRADAVEEILCRVRDANEKVGTPAANQCDRDKVQQSIDYLRRIGYVQGAIVSWLTPGVYPIWSAYRKEGARSWEYRVAVWLTVLRDPAEISYLIGERTKSPSAMFFRRQHGVRAAHAKKILYHDRVSVDDKHYRVLTPDDPYPEWVCDKATMICQMVDYETAEDLACADDINLWSKTMDDNRLSRSAQSLIAEVVQRYADEKLERLHKL